MNHVDLAWNHVRQIPGNKAGACAQADNDACLHGTFVAGILCARRGSVAPAICPNCTLLARPIYTETTGYAQTPSATPDELAAAILECIEAGARVLNLSLALSRPSSRGESVLEEAFDRAAKRGVIVVVAAGNQGAIGSTAITRHPWVIPVVACDLQGRPTVESNLSCSIGKRGLTAPGQGITSLGAEGKPFALGGTSVAAPFVTGAIALLWSEFPAATAAEMKWAVNQAHAPRRTTIVPPLLNAWAMYQAMLNARFR